MSYHTGLISIVLAKLPGVLTFPRNSAAGSLSRADLQTLDRIIDQWDQCESVGEQNLDEIIYIALHHLQRDLDSECRGEVIEDMRREIGYRQWCARNGE
jgi:hypothetical protein